MLRCHTAFTAATFLLSLATLGMSQEDNDLLKRIPQAPARVLQLNNDGNFVDFASMGMGQYLSLLHLPERVDEITLLKKDWVQDELKMTPTQRRHYREAFDEFLKKRAEVPDDLTESLDEKQLEKFRQLLIRCRIRALGIREFFRQPELGLSKEELAAIDECLEKIEPEYSEKIKELRDKTLNDLQKPLTDEQRAQLKIMSAGFLEERSPPIELLVWQLKNIDRYEESIVDKHNPEIRGLFTANNFRLDVDGCLAEETYLFPIVQKDIEETVILQGILGRLSNLFTDPSSSQELQLTDEQVQAAKEIWDEFGRANQEKSANVGKGRPGYSEYQNWKRDYLSKGIRETDRLFMPHQKQLLETASSLLEILRSGLAGSLVYGQPGRKLKLTSDQKSEVKKASAKCLVEVESKTRKWEEEILEKLKRILDDRTRERLEDVFTREHGFGSCNLELLLQKD